MLAKSRPGAGLGAVGWYPGPAAPVPLPSPLPPAAPTAPGAAVGWVWPRVPVPALLDPVASWQLGLRCPWPKGP